MHGSLTTLIALCMIGTAAIAGEDAFSTGPAIPGFGPVADVDGNFTIPDGAVFKVSFDGNTAADAGTLNRTLVSAARFVNMHVRAGVPLDNISLAVVVHGGAVRDLIDAGRYAELAGGKNANAPLVEALTSSGVRIIVCGQSAVYYKVHGDDLLPGVEMALSAMTAHALLQRNGFTVNPF